jgi:phosphatidate cytidylyltransferase
MFNVYYYLKNLSPTQQIGALFILVFGLLLLASCVSFLYSVREHGDDAAADARRQEHRRVDAIIRSSWLMVLVFWLGWATGDGVALILFGLVSFFSLREFLTLSPTRLGDHRSLVLAFFVVLPLQYLLIWGGHFDLFTVLIPVYAFLALPLASALANDPLRFLERNAKLQWGIMVCIYGMSHVPALLMLKFPGYDNRNAFLVFFLVLVVQVCMVTQHFASRRLQRPPVAPAISSSFNWQSWGIGVAAGSLLGAMLAGITPWVPGTAFAAAFVACVAGSLGHFVMKALKRDRGIPSWGAEGQSVTGAGGLLDRVDGLCFAAPVFFHSARWYFGV